MFFVCWSFAIFCLVLSLRTHGKWTKTPGTAWGSVVTVAMRQWLCAFIRQRVAKISAFVSNTISRVSSFILRCEACTRLIRELGLVSCSSWNMHVSWRQPRASRRLCTGAADNICAKYYLKYDYRRLAARPVPFNGLHRVHTRNASHPSSGPDIHMQRFVLVQ